MLLHFVEREVKHKWVGALCHLGNFEEYVSIHASPFQLFLFFCLSAVERIDLVDLTLDSDEVSCDLPKRLH